MATASSSSSDVVVSTSAEEKLSRFLYWDTFAVNRWYDAIQDDTFETRFVPITVDTARVFTDMQAKILMEFIPFDDLPYPTQLAELEQEIDAAIADLHLESNTCLYNSFLSQLKSGGYELSQPSDVNRVFIKLSDRSPKDSATENGRIQRRMQIPESWFHLEKVELDALIESNRHGLPLVYRAFSDAVMCSTGREVIQLLLDSVRIYEDLQQRISYAGAHDWSLQLVVRKWYPMPFEMEFRCFVKHNKLTAISQYFFDCFFPDVLAQKEDIRSTLSSYYYTHIKDKLSKAFCDTYVIDIVLYHCPSATQGSKNDASFDSDKSQHHYLCKVIELNPFDESTDGALFSWGLHRHILEGVSSSADYPVMRVVTSETKKVKGNRLWWKLILRNSFLEERKKRNLANEE